MRVFGLIPAAGKSTRMGRTKLNLPLGDRTVLQCTIGVLREGGVSEVLVVLGPHVAELRDDAEKAGAAVLTLAEETPDMRTTIERGLDWIEHQHHPGADDAWLLVPADHPTLNADVVRTLLQKRSEQPQASIVIPTCAGKRGHPTLIGWQHRSGIRELADGQGLNTYLRSRAACTVEVPVLDAEILCDLDTPEDYRRLLERWQAKDGFGC